MENLRIVFMGTPDFAVESLRALCNARCNVVGVVTVPDKPIGRHQEHLQPSPVKRFAEEHGLKVLQPERLKDEAFLADLQALRADLQVVVAFRMLPEAVWNMPPLGTFNLHASLLPHYRGAAPINRAVMNGETRTGVTTFFLRHEIDTGAVIMQESIEIGDDEDAGSVHDRLMLIGGRLVVETVSRIASGEATATEQEAMDSNGPLNAAPKIFKDDRRIDWSQGVKSAHDFVRGLSPYPAAWTLLRNGERTDELKIYKAHKALCKPLEQERTFIVDDGVRIALSDGYLVIDELQLAGKRRLSAADFVRGLRTAGSLSVE